MILVELRFSLFDADTLVLAWLLQRGRQNSRVLASSERNLGLGYRGRRELSLTFNPP